MNEFNKGAIKCDWFDKVRQPYFFVFHFLLSALCLLSKIHQKLLFHKPPAYQFYENYKTMDTCYLLCIIQIT